MASSPCPCPLLRAPALLCLAALLGGPVAGCAAKSVCALDDEAKDLAGAGATFCGRVAVDAPRTDSDACVRREFEAGRAFWVRYDTQNQETNAFEVAQAIVREPSGRVSLLEYESAPCGSSACSARVTRVVCADPTVSQGDPRKPPIACGETSDRKAICD